MIFTYFFVICLPVHYQWYSGVFDQSEDHNMARDILNKYKQK